VEVEQRQAGVAGLDVSWRQAGNAPVLYLHGVPTASWQWQSFLELSGGFAPDLPGFGKSDKPAGFDYSIGGYDRFIEAFADHVGLERFSLVVHDWGAVGLAFAQRFPERIERLVVLTSVPFLPGYRWHRIARGWRTPLAGEMMMGFTFRFSFRRSLPREIADRSWEDFDHGTQRAILKLYRSAPEQVLEQAGRNLGRVRCPALVLWPTDDPYLGPEFGERYAEALGGPVDLEVIGGGHWTWVERPESVQRVADFLG
jgi:pimeloyl-ACP methyl ester carboxylesterase